MLGHHTELSLSAEYTYRLKCLILGDKDVGKTSLLYTYVKNSPPNHKVMEKDLDFHIKKEIYTVDRQDYLCKLHIWDASGEVCVQKNAFMRKELYTGANAFIMLYCDEKSFKSIANKIWNSIDTSNGIKQQCFYLVPNCKLDIPLSEQLLKRAEEFVKGRPIVNYPPINTHNIAEVKELFRSIVGKIMSRVAQGIALEQVVLRDRDGKVVLKDKSYQSRAKRYNHCC